jgi:drug/metabolite transporter (DMT)-like permease
VLALFLLRTGVHHDAADWLILFGIGLSGLIGQIFLTAALRYGSVSSVIVMDYSAFAWATLWGWLVFDHLPPASTWIGAPIVIAAGLIIAWREHLLHRQRTGDALTA